MPPMRMKRVGNGNDVSLHVATNGMEKVGGSGMGNDKLVMKI